MVKLYWHRGILDTQVEEPQTADIKVMSQVYIPIKNKQTRCFYRLLMNGYRKYRRCGQWQTDIAALRKWSKLDRVTQNRLLANVFCIDCVVTTAIDYEVVSGEEGILIKGKCKKCGQDVARVVEEDWFSHESH